MIKSIYHIAPYSVKCVLASVYGFYLDHVRYDNSFRKRVDRYLERETWTESQLNNWRQDILIKTLCNARKYVPFYKNYWRGKTKSYEQIENWPIITKKIINENPDLFIDQRFNKNKLYHDHTSGTTGTPIDIFLDYDSVKEQYALFEARVKIKYDLEFNDRWAIIGAQRVTSTEQKTPPYWVYNFSSKQLYFSALHIASWSVQDYYQAFVKYQPKYLIGYTNSIFELAKFMFSNNLTFKMKAIITNAEPVYDYQINAMKKVFDCPVVETYGQAELVCFANRFPDGVMYESPEMGYREIITIGDNNDQQFGKLIATGLLNKAMPLIRYDTDDLISTEFEKKMNNNCSLPPFGKILGRNDDILVTQDGRKIVQIDGLFSSDLHILNGQIIQKTNTDFLIKVVPAAGWNKQSVLALKANFLERIQDGNIEIQVCDEIEKTWAGKFRVIKSDIIDE